MHIAFFLIDALVTLLDIVKEMTCDDGFKIPSPSAAAALKTATSLLTWSGSNIANKRACSEFADLLNTQLQAAFKSTAIKFKTKRCKMWGRYHTIRSSDDFHSLWASFLRESPKCDASPIFYQYITDKFFRKLIKFHFPIEDNTESVTPLNLTREELNALRYAAGYVYRAVRKKITSKADNEELLLSLEELLDDPEERGEDDCSREWTNLSSRGGLLHVTDDAFRVFCAIEEVVRQHFHRDKAKDISCGMKEELCAKIRCNDDVLSKWEVVAADMKEDVGSALLGMIIDLWVTIRGFSFAGAWVELYKQKTKKTLQRSMGLRKVLYTQEKN